MPPPPSARTPRRRLPLWFRLLILLLFAYALWCAALYFYQERLIFVGAFRDPADKPFPATLTVGDTPVFLLTPTTPIRGVAFLFHGNDETAVEYYKRCTRRPPVPLAALINLGVLHEDEMRFRDAETCYRQVLAFDPTHPRALLFFKDCRASKDMFYDEEAERGYTVLRQLLEIPVTDFELSVRSRNCLRKMNIRTLGDLTRTTEVALLASKNFGETSLSEIKEMMSSKGVRLGMALEGGERAAEGAVRVDPIEELSSEEKALLAKPIGDLNLSVRARKCMTKLGIQTIGDLVNRSGDEMLECKNFGVTSLNEVRERLVELNLKLKNE